MASHFCFEPACRQKIAAEAAHARVVWPCLWAGTGFGKNRQLLHDALDAGEKNPLYKKLPVYQSALEKAYFDMVIVYCRWQVYGSDVSARKLETGPQGLLGAARGPWSNPGAWRTKRGQLSGSFKEGSFM